MTVTVPPARNTPAAAPGAPFELKGFKSASTNSFKNVLDGFETPGDSVRGSSKQKPEAPNPSPEKKAAAVAVDANLPAQQQPLTPRQIPSPYVTALLIAHDSSTAPQAATQPVERQTADVVTGPSSKEQTADAVPVQHVANPAAPIAKSYIPIEVVFPLTSPAQPGMPQPIPAATPGTSAGRTNSGSASAAMHGQAPEPSPSGAVPASFAQALSHAKSALSTPSAQATRSAPFTPSAPTVAPSVSAPSPVSVPSSLSARLPVEGAPPVQQQQKEINSKAQKSPDAVMKGTGEFTAPASGEPASSVAPAPAAPAPLAEPESTAVNTPQCDSALQPGGQPIARVAPKPAVRRTAMKAAGSQTPEPIPQTGSVAVRPLPTPPEEPKPELNVRPELRASSEQAPRKTELTVTQFVTPAATTQIPMPPPTAQVTPSAGPSTSTATMPAALDAMPQSAASPAMPASIEPNAKTPAPAPTGSRDRAAAISTPDPTSQSAALPDTQAASPGPAKEGSGPSNNHTAQSTIPPATHVAVPEPAKAPAVNSSSAPSAPITAKRDELIQTPLVLPAAPKSAVAPAAANLAFEARMLAPQPTPTDSSAQVKSVALPTPPVSQAKPIVEAKPTAAPPVQNAPRTGNQTAGSTKQEPNVADSTPQKTEPAVTRPAVSQQPATVGTGITTRWSEAGATQAVTLNGAPSRDLTSGSHAAPSPSLEYVRQIIPEAPPTPAPSAILLQVAANDQTAAAIRIADRGGSVNVTVHASDPVLRESLRSNLGDLSAQLNQQGWKTEISRPAAPTAPSQNQPDSHAENKQSSQQQQSFNDGRQASRDRRNTGRNWQQELDQQISSGPALSGGNG